MQRSTFALATRRLALAAAVAAVGLTATACSDDNGDNGTGPALRMYNQVQRLGNPLVSEVLLSKRDHPAHGSIGPDQDATLVAPLVVDFMTTVAGRDPAYIQAIAPALIPDVLVVDTSKDPSTARLAPPARGGYGGRQLQDDVVDLACKLGSNIRAGQIVAPVHSSRNDNLCSLYKQRGPPRGGPPMYSVRGDGSLLDFQRPRPLAVGDSDQRVSLRDVERSGVSMFGSPAGAIFHTWLFSRTTTP